jgi:dipeptidyl aminopeptidase/acylaminoacyl peptidase
VTVRELKINSTQTFMLEGNDNLKQNLKRKILPRRIDKTILTRDGFSVRLKLLLPPHMIDGEKYPLLVEVYGGPGTQSVDSRE